MPRPDQTPAGTEKQHVADNYHARMAGAVRGAAASLGLGTEAGQLQLCPQLNISQCPATAGLATQLTVNLYNPLAWRRRSAVRLPVTSGQYRVTARSSGAEVASQLVQLPAAVVAVPGREGAATHELVFWAEAGPLELATFTVTRHQQQQQQQGPRPAPLSKHGKVTLGRGQLRVLVRHGAAQLLVRHAGLGLDTAAEVSTLYYAAHRGNNSEFEFRASGAYIFRPEGEEARGLGGAEETVTTGPLFDEVTRSWGWATQRLRLYHEEDALEVGWVVGPIPVQDGVGKEVIVR